MNEEVKIMYNRIINEEVVFLMENEVKEIEQYELSINKEKVLNNLIMEHQGDNVFKCYI